MQVTLAKALTIKKQLQTKLGELNKRFIQNFQRFEGDNWIYDPAEVLSEINTVTAQLIDIKCAIQKANEPIENTILTLGELKSWVKLIQNINPGRTGQVRKSNPLTNQWEVIEVPIVSIWTKPELDQKVDAARKTISQMQDELNTFNHKTTIELPFEA